MFLSPLRLALLLGALVGSVLVTVGAGRAAAPIEASGSRVISSAPLTTGADDTGVGSTGTGGTAAGGTAAFAQVGDAPDPVHPLYHSSITAAAAASPAQRPTSELAAQIEALGPAGIGADSLALPDERAVPVRLRVPALAIDAEIIPVGVTAVGDYEVPPASQVGWYRFGSVPGEAGSAVLAAHIAWDGVDGVFRHLADLPVSTRTSFRRRCSIAMASPESCSSRAAVRSTERSAAMRTT